MRVSILTYGSRGDVQPFLALGAGLRAAGHAVRLAAPERFGDLATAQGLDFAGLPGDVEALSQALVDRAGSRVLNTVAVLREFVLPIAAEVMARVRAACADADLVLHTFLTTLAGSTAAEARGVPSVSAQLFPFFAPYTDFPNVGIGRSLGARLNRLSHVLAEQIFWQSSRLSYSHLRRKRPEIGPPRLRWPAPGRRIPLLLAYSPLLVPHPAGAPLARTTGYWFLDEPAWEPPPELAAFLADGPPPLYVGFGSMRSASTARIAAEVLDGLRRSGRRAVLLRGWANLGAAELPPTILAIDGAPHSWLFPRMAAIVHHGGAGTTAAALRAGVPQVVLPFTADQPFWAARVQRAGVAPPPIPAGRVTAEALAAAIAATDAPELRRHAAELGARIRAEDGVGAAIEAIEEIARNGARIERQQG